MDGKDQLKYDYELYGIPMNETEWLEKTYKTKYPYSIVKLWNFFFSNSSCPPDIILTTKSNYDIAKDESIFDYNKYLYGHGGLRSKEIITPVIISGPNIKQNFVLENEIMENVGTTIITSMGRKSQGSGTIINDIFIQQK